MCNNGLQRYVNNIRRVTCLTSQGAMFVPIGPDKPARMYFSKDSDISFKKGTQLLIGKGGFKLKGIFFTEGTKLTVGQDGNFSREK